MPLIECRQLSVRFAEGAALQAIDLACEAGEWLTILGPSGGGKTTLLRAIAGLQPLAGGEVRIDEALATNHAVQIPPHRRGIGFLFQKPSLWPHLSCRANVELGLTDSGLPRAARRVEAEVWLERVGAATLAGRFPSTLSGGQTRQVALARALGARPRILLLDEPTAHLDLHLREELMTLLRRLHGELSLTTLCVIHQVEPPLRLDERAAIIEGGRLGYDGPLARLNEAPPSAYVRALDRWTRRLGETPSQS